MYDVWISWWFILKCDRTSLPLAIYTPFYSPFYCTAIGILNFYGESACNVKFKVSDHSKLSITTAGVLDPLSDRGYWEQWWINSGQCQRRNKPIRLRNERLLNRIFNKNKWRLGRPKGRKKSIDSSDNRLPHQWLSPSPQDFPKFTTISQQQKRVY